MKAIQYTAFGHSDVLRVAEAGKPAFGENEVLLKIMATTVNPMDMKIREGYLQKAMPVVLPYIPGLDASGIVEAAGSKVTRLKPGDEIYATTYGGTYAAYISLNEEQVALKPANISFNEAVALAVPLTTSYTLLIEAAQFKAGQKILVHGAAGGVGSILVQMAKVMGAYVVATASGKEVERVKNLGADEVIDYKMHDFSQMVKNIDIVADLVGGETQTKSFEVLNKGGKLLSIVAPPDAGLAEKYAVAAQFIMSKPFFKKLEFCKAWVEQGKIKAQVAMTMKLEQAAEAQDLLSKGGINGKIVLEIN